MKQVKPKSRRSKKRKDNKIKKAVEESGEFKKQESMNPSQDDEPGEIKEQEAMDTTTSSMATSKESESDSMATSSSASVSMATTSSGGSCFKTLYDSSPMSSPSSISSPSSSSSNSYRISYRDAVKSYIPVKEIKNKGESSMPSLISPERNSKSLVSPSEIPHLLSPEKEKETMQLLGPPVGPIMELSNPAKKKARNHMTDKKRWNQQVNQIRKWGPVFSEKHNYDGVNEVNYQACYKDADDLFERSRAYKKMAESLEGQGKDSEVELYKEMARDAKTQGREQILIASTTMYHSRNHKRKQREKEVDLHGQHKDRALRIVKHHLWQTCTSKAVQDFRIITGHAGGDHGDPELRDAVTKYLKDLGIQSHLEDNDGSVCFTLDGLNKTVKF